MSTPSKIAMPRSLSPGIPAPPPIGGRYVVDLARPLPGAGGGGVGGGLAAFMANDLRDDAAALMAVQARPGEPPREGALSALTGLSGPQMLAPMAHGTALGENGLPGWFVISLAPPGRALWQAGANTVAPWGEADLLTRILRPAAAALAELESRRITHRAVRPENLFAGPNGQPAVLGGAWAGPPAMLQPGVFEPPYVAMCAAAARGEGRIADDVYALGVTMLALALGRLPLAGLDDEAVILRKLEQGCFQALAGDARLPPLIADLLSGMLAQDPEHRPSPALLADPTVARGRRVAARPPRRASRPLEIGNRSATDARTLAFAIAREPEQAARVLRLGVVDHWLRRMLGDAALAGKVEEAVRLRSGDGKADDRPADSRLILRVVVMLDPLAPLCWNGLAVWPDGLGPAVVAAPPADGTPESPMRANAEEIIATEATVLWGLLRGDIGQVNALRDEARKARGLLRQRGWAGGPLRLSYALNPLLACRSAAVGGWPVAQMSDVLPALEAVAGRQQGGAMLPIDRDLAAFLAARQDGRADSELAALGDAGAPDQAAVAQLRVLARLQQRLVADPLPSLAGSLATASAPALEVWRNRARRAERQAALAAAAPKGDLTSLLEILEDPSARGADEQGYAEATATASAIDQRLAGIAADGAGRAEMALRLGQEIAAALGLAALAASAVAAALR